MTSVNFVSGAFLANSSASLAAGVAVCEDKAPMQLKNTAAKMIFKCVFIFLLKSPS
jgi:hypothetical protein